MPGGSPASVRVPVIVEAIADRQSGAGAGERGRSQLALAMMLGLLIIGAFCNELIRMPRHEEETRS